MGSRRRWRKLHLGLDAGTQEIVAAELTPDDVGDVSVLSELLDQIDADVASLTADGAYDGEAAYNAVVERHPATTVVIPRRATAVPSKATTMQRDRHLAVIAEQHDLWRAVDQHRVVLDILVQDRRDSNAAKRFFRRLPKGLQYVPRVIVTDKPRSYGAA